jgi:hypothetical protein
VLLHDSTDEACDVALQASGNLGGKGGLRGYLVHVDILPCEHPGGALQIRPVLDIRVLTINLDVVRLTLHVLGATIWVGGQVILGALVGPLRKVAPAAIPVAARTFAWVAWPAYALLVVTGVWLIAGAGEQSDAYRTTLMVKMVFVVISGIGAALHTFVKNPALKGFWAAVGLVGALGAVLLGVSIIEAP